VGCSQRVDKLICHTSFNVDDYGKALCEGHGIGLTPEAFKTTFASNEPSYVFNSNAWIISKLGWKIKSNIQELLPVLAESETPCKSYGGSVQVG
jgi:hypothetical protein